MQTNFEKYKYEIFIQILGEGETHLNASLTARQAVILKKKKPADGGFQHQLFMKLVKINGQKEE